jgi:putative hydrolase of the HAD superfamily
MAKTNLKDNMGRTLPKEKYTSIFFDLDHTLWDYEMNSQETLSELFEEYSLQEAGVTDFQSFHHHFKRVNNALWHLYDHGKIDSTVIRKERFKQILETFNIRNEKLTQDLSHQYLHTCPKKGNLIPQAVETLEYLASRYTLSIITNGFEEIQNVKLMAGNIHRFFSHIITSQMAGHKKPAREIFEYAMQKNNILADQVVMVGDNLVTDIAGARLASIDTVFFNPEGVQHDENVTLEITNLRELCTHL